MFQEVKKHHSNMDRTNSQSAIVPKNQPGLPGGPKVGRRSVGDFMSGLGGFGGMGGPSEEVQNLTKKL